MLIKCPLSNSAAEVPLLVKAGADSFYAGVSSAIILGQEGGVVNRRNLPKANFEDLNEFQKSCHLAHELQRKMYLALNEHCYDDDAIQKIVDFVTRQERFIDGVLISDLGLILELRKRLPDMTIVASIGTGIFNSRAAEFWKQFSIRQAVLPRQLSIQEISNLLRIQPDMRWESIILEGDCWNTDAFCRFTHGIFDKPWETSACKKLFNISLSGSTGSDAVSDEVLGRSQRISIMMNNVCGVCAIWDFERAGLHAVKIIERPAPLKRRLLNTYFVKRSLAYLNLPRDQYRKKIHALYQTIFKRQCSRRCLYSDET